MEWMCIVFTFQWANGTQFLQIDKIADTFEGIL